MKWIKKHKYLTVSLIGFLMMALVACQPKLTPEEDCNFVMSSQIQRVSWKNDLPISLYITDSVPSEFHEAIRIAAAQWNYKINKTAFVIYGGNGIPASPAKDNVNGIYWVPNWKSKKEEQAKTTIHWRGDKIREADVLLNAQDHEFSSFGNIQPGKVDMVSLMVHEFGHVLGLQHIKGSPSVMAESLAYAQTRDRPFDIDVNSLKCEYF